MLANQALDQEAKFGAKQLVALVGDFLPSLVQRAVLA